MHLVTISPLRHGERGVWGLFYQNSWVFDLEDLRPEQFDPELTAEGLRSRAQTWKGGEF